MHIALWVLQAVLALKFASVAYTHGLRPDPAKMEHGRQILGAAARPLLLLAAVGSFLGALGLILPPPIGAPAWLVPLAAGLLALLMLGAIGLHLGCRERPKTVVALVLFALSAALAHARWALMPL